MVELAPPTNLEASAKQIDRLDLAARDGADAVVAYLAP
jgi:hypothetical protein